MWPAGGGEGGRWCCCRTLKTASLEDLSGLLKIPPSGQREVCTAAPQRPKAFSGVYVVGISVCLVGPALPGDGALRGTGAEGCFGFWRLPWLHGALGCPANKQRWGEDGPSGLHTASLQPVLRHLGGEVPWRGEPQHKSIRCKGFSRLDSLVLPW